MRTGILSPISRHDDPVRSGSSQFVSVDAYRVMLALVVSTWITLAVVTVIALVLFGRIRENRVSLHEQESRSRVASAGTQLVPVAAASLEWPREKNMTAEELLEWLDREAEEKARAMSGLSAQAD